MPGVKRTRSQARIGRRKRFKRSNVGRPRQLLHRGPSAYHFKRSFQSSLIALNASGANTIGYSFALNQLPNYTEFTSLFDLYRLNYVVMKFVPNWTGNDNNPVTTAWSAPNFHSVIDHDDSTNPTSIDYMLQYPSHQMTQGHKIHIRKFRPSVLAQMYTGATDSTCPKYKQWLNCADASTPHYGLKVYIDAPNTTCGAYRVFVTVYLSCKGVR